MTRKMSKMSVFWLWFPLFFNICTLVLSIINVLTDLKLLNSIVWIMVYIVPWLLFIQARLEVRKSWNDWLREASTLCDYMVAQSRILIMLNNVEDEKTRARLLKEYGAIVKECILEDEENEASEL